VINFLLLYGSFDHKDYLQKYTQEEHTKAVEIDEIRAERKEGHWVNERFFQN